MEEGVSGSDSKDPVWSGPGHALAPGQTSPGPGGKATAGGAPPARDRTHPRPREGGRRARKTLPGSTRHHAPSGPQTTRWPGPARLGHSLSADCSPLGARPVLQDESKCGLQVSGPDRPCLEQDRDPFPQGQFVGLVTLLKVEKTGWRSRAARNEGRLPFAIDRVWFLTLHLVPRALPSGGIQEWVPVT